MSYNKAYKFRIYPNEEQEVLLAKTFGCVRLVYNYYLDCKIKAYETNKKSMSYNDCAKDLVSLKKDRSFLKEVDSISLQQSLRHLDTAYQNFFRDKKVGFPKFKSKKNHHFSYSTVCVNNNIRLEDGYLILPKIKAVKIKQHRTIPTNYILKSVTISKTPTDKYFVSILYEYDVEIKAVEPITSIGLDFSMNELFVSSEGETADYPRYYKKSLEKLAREQRILSHRQKGSNRYYQQKRKVGKSVADNGWGMFSTFLAYKLAELGKTLVKVDKWYPSSKTCHVCGYVYQDLQLSERKWTCSCCNTIHDRDKNASINIKRKGLEMLTLSA